MSEAALRVGIVGLSASRGFAAGTHAPALAALAGYELRGLVGSSPERAAAAAGQHGIPLTFRDAAQLAGSDQIDLIVVTVKVPEHERVLRQTLVAGKPVLCEWPLGNGLAEAEKLAEAAAEQGVRTAVGLQARSAPSVRFLRDLVADGYVGEVLSSTTIGSGGGWGAEVATAADRYTIDVANGATLLTIPMGHALGAVCFVLGVLGEVRARAAIRRPWMHDIEADAIVSMNTPDQIAVTGVLPGGGVFSAHYRGGLCRGTNLRWEINGTKGDIVVTSSFGNVQLADLTLRGGAAETTRRSFRSRSRIATTLFPSWRASRPMCSTWPMPTPSCSRICAQAVRLSPTLPTPRAIIACSIRSRPRPAPDARRMPS